jgi:penicillin-binding protein 2A
MPEQRPPSRVGTEKKPANGKKKGKKKLTGKRVMAWLFFTAAIAVVCGIIGYLLIILNGERILAANQDKLVMEEASTIYDVNDKEITKLSRINRESVQLNDIPELQRNAFIATEDKRFYEHAGVDFFAIGRAVVKDVIARSAVEGGSTITQQLAKNMFLSHDKTFFRKASEASIAVALENQLTKDQILEMYLNRIFFGQRAYGIKAAAEVYFGIDDLKKLELWQMATLAGIPKAPSNYNPITDADKSRERMSIVLQLMYEQKLITAQQVEEAKAKALKYEPPGKAKALGDSEAYLAYIDYVVNEAQKVTGMSEEKLLLGGYNIYTTLNTKAQTIVEKEFADASNFEKSPDDQIVQGAMVIIDHRTGEIEAMAGGRDYAKKGTNRVLDTRQPGSSFKPVAVYGPALETGNWFPWSIVKDEKTCYGTYCPTDSNRVKYIGDISMTQSVKESRNASAVWLLNEIGVGVGMDFAKTLGFELDSNDRNLTIGLGGLTHGVTPMQMATAYSVFANGGKSVDPHSIAKITDKDGTVKYTYTAPRVKQLMQPETAWYMTELLQGVLEQGGTGTGARIDRPVAGKTGTTQHGLKIRSSGNRDAWFVGYTPEWTAAVWMGYVKTDAQHLLKRSSAQSAEMFAKVMSQALKDVPVSQFVKPSGVKVSNEPKAVGGFTGVYDEAQGLVRLSWSAQSGDGISYRVYRKEASESDYTMISESPGTAVDDISAQPGMTYEYYVKSYQSQSGNEGKSSAHKTISIPALTITPSPDDPMNSGEPLPGDENTDLPVDPGTIDPGIDNPGNADPGTGDDAGNNSGTNSGTDPGADNPVEGTNPPANGGNDNTTTDPESPGTGQDSPNIQKESTNSGTVPVTPASPKSRQNNDAGGNDAAVAEPVAAETTP